MINRLVVKKVYYRSELFKTDLTYSYDLIYCHKRNYYDQDCVFCSYKKNYYYQNCVSSKSDSLEKYNTAVNNFVRYVFERKGYRVVYIPFEIK